MPTRIVPTTLKLLRGNPGKRPLNKNEPKPIGNLVKAPAWMTDSQKESWDYAINNSPRGLLKLIDRSVLAVWVIAEDTHRLAAQCVAKNGLIDVAQNGTDMPSQYLAIVNKQAVIMMKAACDLGFNPTSRTKIAIEDSPAENEFDDL